MIDFILQRLDAEASAIETEWNASDRGTRTRHCAIDSLLPDDVALAIHAAFPRDGEGFMTRKSFREHKRTSANLDQYPLILADITYALQNPRVTQRISELTGMDGMEPDPHLYAGGLSMMFPGDFLNPHIDNSHESSRSKYRRINLLYYVTPEWRPEYGGNLELWDDQVTSPVTIPSLFNRLVLMETNKLSWHSVSQVVPGRGPRCCVSNYYFSEKSPTGDDYYHVTSFTGRPEQKIRRALGLVDNAARNYARERLGMTRATDKGYSGTLANDE
ncbi:2OG-Fe(II) oxygenase [Sphingomonas naasensis]|uniref:2OG-Fe(II) oxygenase n=2 Tax=Sphingomonas naasensis TaxID=1344951 RepID=A0A4S1WWD4_9SPHN|nr:2OG-Fe(II) oxygenase [Sphingomonas naasensis]